MTRAVISVLKLNFRQAFQYHPLFPIVPGGLYYVGIHSLEKWLHIGQKTGRYYADDSRTDFSDQVDMDKD